MFWRKKEATWPRLGELRRQEMREWEDEFNHLSGIKPRKPGDGFAQDIIAAIQFNAVAQRDLLASAERLNNA